MAIARKPCQPATRSFWRTLRELLKLEGTPIRLEFKSGTNPYEGRKNVLTDRQVHKRKRMIKRMKK